MNFIDEQTLAQVARDICETMLGLPMWRSEFLAPNERRLLATIQISGESTASVEVETVCELATQIACRMFSRKPEDLTESDLRDALGEVINMIGGNVKGILCGEFGLSLPTVREADEPRSASEIDSLTVRLSCAGSPLIVRLKTLKGRTLTA